MQAKLIEAIGNGSIKLKHFNGNAVGFRELTGIVIESYLFNFMEEIDGIVLKFFVSLKEICYTVNDNGMIKDRSEDSIVECLNNIDSNRYKFVISVTEWINIIDEIPKFPKVGIKTCCTTATNSVPNALSIVDSAVDVVDYFIKFACGDHWL